MISKSFDSQIGKLNEAIRKHLDAPEFRSFRDARGNLKLSDEARNAFGACVSNLHAVRVTGCTDARTRYVLELDITPHADICADLEFGFVLNGDVRRLFRQGSSNIDQKQMDKKREGTFGNEVQKRAHWRKTAEMNEKRDQLVREAAELGPVSAEGQEKKGILGLITATVSEVYGTQS